jgi:hypothetical protein
MRTLRFRNLAITLAAAVTLGGCTSYYGGYGGYGSGGYGGLSVGIGTGGGYYDPYYGGSPYWGWNDGYYYPGTGYYVYDTYRRPHRWSDSQQRYWSQRRAVTGTTSTMRTTSARPNWSDFKRSRATVGTTAGTTTTTATKPNHSDRQERAQSRIERQQSVVTETTTSNDRPRRKR